MSRRSFCKALAISAVSTSALGQERAAIAGTPTEWAYTSGKQYADPFNQVDLDVVIVTPIGKEERVPAFWAGAVRSSGAGQLQDSFCLQRHR